MDRVKETYPFLFTYLVMWKNDYLNEIYADDIEGAKEDLRVLEITPKEAAYLDHRTHPIFTRKFEF